MTPVESLHRNRSRIRDILARYDVSNPRLFGSAARGQDNAESDLDILVDPGAQLSYFDLAELEAELQSLLGCRVDVTTPAGLAADVRNNVERELKALLSTAVDP